MSFLSKKIKRVLKNDHANIRDICIIISNYFQDIGFVPLSPNDIKSESSNEELMHNFFLARAHYAEKFSIPLPGARDERPEQPRKKRYWTDHNYQVFLWDPLYQQWSDITHPVYPGKLKTLTEQSAHETATKTDKKTDH